MRVQLRSIRTTRLAAAGLAALLGVGGCPENYPAAVGITQAEVGAIRSDTALSPQERREALLERGLSPLLVNTILGDERIGNQFGGNERSVFDKLTEPNLAGLTPDEVQIFSDLASSLDDTLPANITDATAQDVADLLAGNDIRSADDLDAFLDGQPDTDEFVTGLTVGQARALFIDFDTNELIPLLP